VISQLADPETGQRTHAELEEQLSVDGRELMRPLLQDHLDLRARREVRQEGVTGADGVARRAVEPAHERGLATVFGQVRVARLAYRARGVVNLLPADVVLNLPSTKHSHGLRRLAAIESTRSFEAAVDVDAFYTHPPPRSRPRQRRPGALGER
jgi:hypothetical protein